MARSPILYVAVPLLLGAALLCWFNSSPPTSALMAPPIAQDDASPAIPLPIIPSSDRNAELPPGLFLKFTDVTGPSGIEFKHINGATPNNYIMESMGSGLGWLDYDQDGLMDLFLVQGATFGASRSETPNKCKLYKNLGGGHFRDVTEEVGLNHSRCGLGVAVGDVDNDGFPDLYVTCFGEPNVLYHNTRNGKGGRHFVDVTKKAGIANHPSWATRPNFSTSAAFLDYDGDGFLDLFVCSYVHVNLEHYPWCQTKKGHRAICQPSQFEGTRCLLYRNNGDGTFTDVSHQTGIDQPNAKSLGVIALDLDDDGKIDIFVANDGVPNFLFRNRGNGTFESIGPAGGCAVNLLGLPQAYMGVDAEDVNGDGRPDLFVTAFSQETNTLFRNDGGCQFLDITRTTGLGPPSWWMLGFGTCFLDVDRDGNPDIFVANGHVSRLIEEDEIPNLAFRQPAQLFLNNSRGRFLDVSAGAGDYFRHNHVGRGVAPCDYDNDGHADLAVSNNGEEAYLLHNDSRTPNHWVRLELQGTKSNRDAVGAKITLHLPGSRRLVRHRKGGGSYLSAGDPRLLVGLGQARQVDRLEVRWPSGAVQQFGPLQVDCAYRLVEGETQVRTRP